MANLPSIGIIGAGRVGTVLARLLTRAGYDVRISNSRGKASLGLMLSVLLPSAVAAEVSEVMSESDIIILAIPLHQYESLNATALQGKIVIDAMNYWPPVEGDIPAFTQTTLSSSEVLANHFKGARLVKTFNHVAYGELEEHAQPDNPDNRRVILMASDDAEAKQIVAQMIQAIGFDPVDMGALSAGSQFQPDTPLFNSRFTKEKMSNTD